jgi:hypothetical protein
MLIRTKYHWVSLAMSVFYFLMAEQSVREKNDPSSVYFYVGAGGRFSFYGRPYTPRSKAAFSQSAFSSYPFAAVASRTSKASALIGAMKRWERHRNRSMAEVWQETCPTAQSRFPITRGTSTPGAASQVLALSDKVGIRARQQTTAESCPPARPPGFQESWSQRHSSESAVHHLTAAESNSQSPAPGCRAPP